MAGAAPPYPLQRAARRVSGGGAAQSRSAIGTAAALPQAGGACGHLAHSAVTAAHSGSRVCAPSRGAHSLGRVGSFRSVLRHNIVYSSARIMHSCAGVAPRPLLATTCRARLGAHHITWQGGGPPFSAHQYIILRYLRSLLIMPCASSRNAPRALIHSAPRSVLTP